MLAVSSCLLFLFLFGCGRGVDVGLHATARSAFVPPFTPWLAPRPCVLTAPLPPDHRCVCYLDAVSGGRQVMTLLTVVLAVMKAHYTPN